MLSERGTQASCLLIKSENDQGVKQVMLEVRYPGLIQNHVGRPLTVANINKPFNSPFLFFVQGLCHSRLSVLTVSMRT